MIIRQPSVEITRDGCKLVAEMSSCHGTQNVWYSLPGDRAHWFAIDRLDGFVVGLLLQAMTMGEDIETEAPMSSKLYHSLQGFYIPLLASVFPKLRAINLRPAGLVNASAGGQSVATGFSGGIDSFATVAQHLANEASEDHRVSHFLFHNVGSHLDGNHDDARMLFNQRLQVLKPFAEEVNIPFVPVDSNVSEVLPIDFMRMHHSLNASVVLALQGEFRRYFYASTYRYADCTHGAIDDIARYDPVAFHQFSTEGLDCVSTGCQLSRVEKTSLVADYEPSHRFLNVCVDAELEGLNCSTCFKCRRTLLTLELLGKQHLFTNVFNLEQYRSIRAKYIKNSILRVRPGSFESEICDLAIAVSEEKWADTLRARARGREALNNTKLFVSSVRAPLGKIARMLRLR